MSHATPPRPGLHPASGRRQWLRRLPGLAAAAAAVATPVRAGQAPAAASACPPGPAPGGADRLLAAVLAAFGSTANALVAPSSLATLLQLLQLGARGETARLLAAAGAGLAADGRCAAADARAEPATAAGRPWRAATSLWLAPGSQLAAGYQAQAQACCAAELFTLAAQPEAAVNAWVSRATEGRIPQVVDRLPEQLRLLLVNAVHYRGVWLQPFDPADTRPAPFQLADGRSRHVPLMQRSGQFGWQQLADHACVQVPLADRQMLLEIRLPQAAAANPATLLAAALAPAAATPLPVQPGQLWLPRLTLRSSQSLRPALAGAGLARVFDRGRADFSGLLAGGGVAVDDLRQSVLLAIDEQGAEAAAATSAAVVAALAPPKAGFTLRVDRPFLAALRHRRDGTLMALALVRDPGA